MEHKRYLRLDEIRGWAVISMILYHGVWDLVYMFSVDLEWYRRTLGYIWQQSICWVFILVSGFCWSLGRKRLKRGLVVFMAGAIVSLVTIIAMPENKVVFGILTLTGSSMLFMILVDKLCGKWNAYVGLGISIGLFVLTRNVNRGWLGFEGWRLVKLPESMYSNFFTTFLGFPQPGFTSTDYFSLFPWFFLFMTGFFLYSIFTKKELMHLLEGRKPTPISWVGKHALPIYLIHQPLLYLIFMLSF